MNKLTFTTFALAAAVPAIAATEDNNTSPHRPHYVRRHGILRPRLLRRRSPHPEY